jgi:hypothetical protein
VAIHPYSFLLLVEVGYSSDIGLYRALRELGLVLQYVVADLAALCPQRPSCNLLYKKKEQLVLSNSITIAVLLPLTEYLTNIRTKVCALKL